MATLPSICQDVNKYSYKLKETYNPIEISRIKSAISRQHELIAIQGDIVSILPDREPVSIMAGLNRYPGPEIRVHIDFSRQRFVIFEWHLDIKPKQPAKNIRAGSIET
ncbi:hypothetical protein CVD19_04015 [Bacillus sp. T33-2]|nr:hypothetical protein CVD19_04015 [Bacillus sp. T33-2]